MDEIKLLGRIFFNCEIEAVTGLHIGGMGSALEIGGVDNPVVRDVLTQEPYIPGSSLRGKMRSQMERKEGSPQNLPIGNNVSMHVCKDEMLKNPCRVCRLFGVPASKNGGSPTLLLIRDVRMTKDTLQKLEIAHTDQQYTELKAEVTIDRVTSMATPRNLERVPAGSVFGPAEMVLSIFRKEDLESLKDLWDCLQLVEDDYIGGGGSRGNGKVRFVNLKITARNASRYNQKNELGVYQDLKELEADYEAFTKKASAALLSSGG